MRLAYAAGALRGNRSVWPTPDVLPLEAWKAREIERRAASGETLPRLLTNAEEWFLWRQAAAELTGELELVARGPLAESLRRASHLAQEFGIPLARAKGMTGSEGRLLFEVHQVVTQRVRALGAITAAELGPQLDCLGGSTPIVAAGFTQQTPSFAALVASRSAGGCETRMRVPQPDTTNQTRAVFAGDAAEELERIAAWCRSRVIAQPDARLLVLVPGAPEARERLVTLIRQSIDPQNAASGDLRRFSTNTLVAVEGGMPLSRAPLVSHALRVLSWLSGGLEFSDFSAWLCGPFWAVPETARVRLDMWLRERAPLELLPRELLSAIESAHEAVRAAAEPLHVQVTQALRELGSGRASPRQWSERFEKTLQALQWPGDRLLNSDEEQTRIRFKELLDDFGQLAAVAGAMSRGEAVQWLTELAARTSFRPASGDVLVTVAPQLVDPIVQYDGIWVAGLHADTWPQPVQSDPFLPLDAQIDAGVQVASAQGRAEEAQALMAAWRASATELVLSAPLRAEDVQIAPSPLLQSYITDRKEEAPSIWLPLRVRREGLTEGIEDITGTPWDMSVRVPSGTRSIELQNLCPFRAYGELRLGSGEMDAPEPGVAADVRGRLLHKALERLWRVLGGSAGLLAQSAESLDELIARCVDEAAQTKEVMGLVPADERPAVQRRECRRAARLIRGLCDVERRRLPFTVRDTEVDRDLELAGAQLRVRIDRVDTLATGGLAILDYKSGRATSGDWYSERPSHPQLLAYLAAVGDETQAMATVSVTAREIRFDGVAADPSLLPKVRAVEAGSVDEAVEPWAYWQREWRKRIEHLAADFVAGRAPVDPRPKACEWCQVVSICRISDASATAVEQNIDD